MDKIIHIPGFNLKITRRLIVDLSLHFFTTLLAAYLFYSITNNIIWVILVFVGGILIDTDHFIDYFLHLDKWDIHSFLHGHFIASRKLYLIFHAWELVLIIAISSLIFSFLIPLWVGMMIHLIIDSLMHARTMPLKYFILFRWKHNFCFDKFDYYFYKKQMKNLRNAGLLKEDEKVEE